MAEPDYLRTKVDIILARRAGPHRRLPAAAPEAVAAGLAPGELQDLNPGRFRP